MILYYMINDISRTSEQNTDMNSKVCELLPEFSCHDVSFNS